MINLMVCLEVSYDTLPIAEAHVKFLKDPCEWVDKYEAEHYSEMKITDVYAVAGREVLKGKKKSAK